jgi:hypothetical protein
MIFEITRRSAVPDRSSAGLMLRGVQIRMQLSLDHRLRQCIHAQPGTRGLNTAMNGFALALIARGKRMAARRKRGWGFAGKRRERGWGMFLNQHRKGPERWSGFAELMGAIADRVWNANEVGGQTPGGAGGLWARVAIISNI